MDGFSIQARDSFGAGPDRPRRLTVGRDAWPINTGRALPPDTNAVIMIEHVMKAIMNVCERIMVLHHGEKIAEGTPQEIATSEKVIKVYLGDKAHASG